MRKKWEYPGYINAYDIARGSYNQAQTELTLAGRKRWVVARPLGFQSIRSRFKLTWLVFTGKADALFWPGQGDK